MTLKDALQDSGLAEAWYENYTAVVVKEGEGEYKLVLQQKNRAPRFTRERLSLTQIENELRAVGMPSPINWSAVDLEG